MFIVVKSMPNFSSFSYDAMSLMEANSKSDLNIF